MPKLPCLLWVVAALLAGCASLPPNAPIKVRVLAINDFHGHLRPSASGLRIHDPARPGESLRVAAGGAERLATVVTELRQKHPNHIFVAAGDLVGASPLLSSLFHDEPTVDALGLMQLELSAVGNHEFDEGWQELLRLQHGGCHPRDGCKGPAPFTGARFQYLAASTVNTATGKTLLPAYVIKRFEGIPVAFIGLTLEGTPGLVMAESVVGIEFRDEAETVNQLVPELRAQGIEAIVVLIHEGGTPTGNYNECPGISGPIVDIVTTLDKAVDVVVSGHTAHAYNCRIDGRLVTSADKYGTVVTAIDLLLDPQSSDISHAVADNVIVHSDGAKDPRLTHLIEQYDALSAALAKRAVGRIGADLTLARNRAGESALGQVVADAHLAGTRIAGAELAFMNPYGLRASLARPVDGELHYEDLFSVQPFQTNLITLTLSGAQILEILEQQWRGPSPNGSVLQVSDGFSYRWDGRRPLGQRVIIDSMNLHGQIIDLKNDYKVTANAFLAGGGDNFPQFREGRDARTGVMDVDALEQYIKDNPSLVPGPLDRIERLD